VKGTKEMQMKEMLTATRMGTVLACPRKHYWRYEVGLHAVTDGMALRFGTAWHKAMEMRWQGLGFEDALVAAGDGTNFDEITIATFGGLLSAYYARYADSEIVKELHAEVEFRLPLAGSRTFDAAGKIDGLGVLHDGRLALVEHKTCGTDIGPESDYWLRLRFNQQVYQYVLAARALGWDVQIVIYDATRKPAIRQKQGETASEFGERLAADAMARPEFYFARREVPILDQDLAEFEVQRLALSRQILFFRSGGRRARPPGAGGAPNCNEMTCKFCEFEGFCMQNISVDPGAPPAGFRVGAINSELGGQTV
jgi:hypothetical protein